MDYYRDRGTYSRNDVDYLEQVGETSKLQSYFIRERMVPSERLAKGGEKRRLARKSVIAAIIRDVPVARWPPPTNAHVTSRNQPSRRLRYSGWFLFFFLKAPPGGIDLPGQSC